MALDLLSDLAEGLKTSIGNLVKDSKIFYLLCIGMQDPLAGIRKSSFTLLGFLTKACFQHVRIYLGIFIIYIYIYTRVCVCVCIY